VNAPACRSAAGFSSNTNTGMSSCRFWFNDGWTGVLEPPSEYGKAGKPEEEYEFLSGIIRRINDIYGIELTEEDKLDLENVHKRMVSHPEVKTMMKGDNSEQDRRDFFYKVVGDIFIDYVKDRFDFYKKVEDPKINGLIKEGLYKKYRKEVDMSI
jgi:type I restriction enzyme, R subunit